MAPRSTEKISPSAVTIFETALERITSIRPYGAQWFWSHLVVTFGLLVWGWRLMKMDYRDGEMAGSLMHSILLPFHEAGHVFLRPFGEFMMVAGGSIFQVLIPLVVAGSFIWQQRDAVGASIGVWWCGVSLMDLAPYIYDAKEPKLTLLSGKTGDAGGHDWMYLLGRFNVVEKAQSYGLVAHEVGALIMVIGIGLALLVLFRSWFARD